MSSREQDGADAALVWVTRSQPGADDTAKKLRAIGVSALVAPVLMTAPVDAVLSLSPDEDLVVTSRMGVERAAALSRRRDHVVYAVGDATAAAARAKGYAEVVSASGDATALGRLILSGSHRRGVVHASGVEVAQDLTGALAAGGLRSRRVVVYRTEALGIAPDEVLTALESRRLLAVLAHSPRGGAAAAALIAPLNQRPGAAIGLSEACLAPFRDLAGMTLVASPRPTDAALLRTLEAVLRRQR